MADKVLIYDASEYGFREPVRLRILTDGDELTALAEESQRAKVEAVRFGVKKRWYQTALFLAACWEAPLPKGGAPVTIEFLLGVGKKCGQLFTELNTAIAIAQNKDRLTLKSESADEREITEAQIDEIRGKIQNLPELLAKDDGALDDFFDWAAPITSPSSEPASNTAEGIRGNSGIPASPVQAG